MASAPIVMEFVDPDARQPTERQSKMLRPGSGLHDWILQARDRLHAAGFVFDTRPPHIELLHMAERAAADVEHRMATRARALHGTALARPLVLTAMGKALVVATPAVAGYGPTHATVAYFAGGLTADMCARAGAALAE